MMNENKELIEKVYSFQVDKITSDIDTTVRSMMKINDNIKNISI